MARRRASTAALTKVPFPRSRKPGVIKFARTGDYRGVPAFTQIRATKRRGPRVGGLGQRSSGRSVIAGDTVTAYRHGRKYVTGISEPAGRGKLRVGRRPGHAGRVYSKSDVRHATPVENRMLRGGWMPKLHPRGHNGRFIKKNVGRH